MYADNVYVTSQHNTLHAINGCIVYVYVTNHSYALGWISFICDTFRWIYLVRNGRTVGHIVVTKSTWVILKHTLRRHLFHTRACVQGYRWLENNNTLRRYDRTFETLKFKFKRWTLHHVIKALNHVHIVTFGTILY